MKQKILRLHNYRECRIINRLNRFTVEVVTSQGIFPVHITNTGRLLEYIKRDKLGLLIPINGRKLRYRLVGVWDNDYYALIDTRLQAVAFEKLIEMNLLPRFEGYKIYSRNPRINHSVLDYKLVNEVGKEILIETKSAVLRGKDNSAMYPDCPTTRGRRHIKEIIRLRNRGCEAVIVFIAGLKNVTCFKPYSEGDKVVEYLLGILYRIAPHSLHCLSIYIDKDGLIILDKPNVPVCRMWINKIY